MPFVDSAGVRIWYETVGRGLPLVMLHGGASDGTAWREAGYVDALQADFKLILIDQRGAGRSDKPPDPQAHVVERYVEDALRVLDDLGVRSFAVWGWSWGGDPAIELAHGLPDRVEAAVLTGNVPGPMSEEGMQWVEENLVRPVRARGMAAILELAMDMEGDALPEWTRRQISETDPAAFIATAIGHSRHPGLSSGDLASMSVPVLLITGEREDPRRAAEREARNIPAGSAAVLPGLNHIGAFDRSDLTVPLFRRFLDQKRASDGPRPESA